MLEAIPRKFGINCIKICDNCPDAFLSLQTEYNSNLEEQEKISASLPSGWSSYLPSCSCPAWWLCAPATAAPQPCSLQSHPAALGAWPLSPGDRRWSPAPPVEDHYYSVAQAPAWRGETERGQWVNVHFKRQQNAPLITLHSHEWNCLALREGLTCTVIINISLDTID